MIGKRTTWMIALLALLALSGTGCAFGEFHLTDPFDRGYTLREAQRHYTELVRWSEFTKASEFVIDDVRDSFVAGAPSLRELRFTDYETGTVDIDGETGGSVVEVTYYAYTPTSPLEISIVETQVWARDGITNDWRVTPKFAGLEDLALNRKR